jgi:hypothetical protein
MLWRFVVCFSGLVVFVCGFCGYGGYDYEGE